MSNKLREILKPYILDPSRAEAEIKAYIMDIIGENENPDDIPSVAIAAIYQGRNQLRSEQRNRLNMVE